MARRKSSSAQASVQQGPADGELFGFPQITRWTEFPDVNTSLVTTLSQANSVPVTGILPFRQTDIAFGWMYNATIAGTYAAGTQTLNTSQYFPYDFYGNMKVSITNLYDMIDVQSGIDLAIFNSYRPARGANNKHWSVYTNPSAWPYSPEANNVSSSAYTTASTSMNLRFYIPASLWFDEYFELGPDGSTQALANRVPVSPLFMSGVARDIFPVITMNPALASNTDSGPVVATGTLTTPATFTGGSVTHDFRRLGIYNTANRSEWPTVFNWRYALVSRRVALPGVSQIDIPVKNVLNNGGGGQILSMFCRFYNPAGGGNSQGISYAITNVSRGKLIYGSNFIRFDDTPTSMQARVFEQHDLNLPIGIWLWDMALDDNARVTNARMINAYTTDCYIHFDFTSALSSSAYVVVGVEYLTYVIDQPVGA
jgi:hypothetical protein